MFYADAYTPVGCAARMYIVFYTNGDTAKDDQGRDALGFEIMVTRSPSTDVIEFHEFRVEQSGNRVTWYVDDRKLGEVVLNGTLQSFVFFIMLIRYRLASEATPSAEQSETPVPGDAYGIIIYDVTAEYYDWLEDVFSAITQVMVVMMFAMVGITLITTLIRAFRVRG
jgi:hypothetical protein